MVRQWKVDLRGHSVTVCIEDKDNSFTGYVSSSEYGQVPVTNCRKEGRVYKGDVTLNGVDAHLEAYTTPSNLLCGTIHVGWFISVTFTGIPIQVSSV